MMRRKGLVPPAMIVTWRFRAGPPEGHSVAGSIEHGGLRRTYLLHVPPSLPRGEPVSPVRALHGTGGLPFLPERIVERIRRGLDASALLWDFLARHPRPG